MRKQDFRDLNGEAAKKFCHLFEHIEFVIIDEFSIVGLNMLGDIRQLPPVKDYPLYSNLDQGDLVQRGKAAFLSFEKVFLLNQSFRQKDKNFEELVDRVTLGATTLSDYNVLKTRFTFVNSGKYNCLEERIHLYSTQQEVLNYNYEKMKSLKDDFRLSKSKDDEGMPAPVARIEARNNNRAASKGSVEEADGLSPVLYLAKRCRVMLKRNLWTKQGLVNGSMGSVKDIFFHCIDGVNKKPEIIMCQFDSYIGPGIGPQNLVPIGRVFKTWTDSHGNSCTRVAFPLIVCYAVSIHKSQGLTLEKAQINIGEREFALGLTYVALSRVKSMDGLFLAPLCFDRISRLQNSEGMKQRLKFEEELRNLVTRKRGCSVRMETDHDKLAAVTAIGAAESPKKRPAETEQGTPSEKEKRI